MKLFENTDYDFLGRRKIAYLASLAVILIGLVSVILNQGLNYHIDFEGGLSLEVVPYSVTEPHTLTVGQVREALHRNGVTSAEIQELLRTNSFLIRTKAGEKGGDEILRIMREEFPNHTNHEDFIRSQEEVGPRAGADLRRKAVNAVLISLVFMLVYIWIRFRFVWGFIAAFGLFHDTLIALVVISLLNIEIGMTVMAGLLTIVAYSVNNTIVIFDRIRENLKLYRKDDDAAIINRSINETLSRTIITSFSTLLVCIPLMIFGGAAIFNFAFIFTIGIIAGTYCSWFIATGLIYDIVLVSKTKKLAKKK